MKILVLAGGTSTERDVSFVTGSMVYKALKEKGHSAVLIDVYYGVEDERLEKLGGNAFTADIDWAEHIAKVSEQEPDLKSVIANRPVSPDGYFGPNVLKLCKEADIVFLGLHGENGENGKIQAAFDLLGIKYTGTDYLSSALAMDKCLTKCIFTSKGIPTPDYFIICPGMVDTADTEGAIRYPDSYPAVVKTSCGGSSVGVYIVSDSDEYRKAVVQALEYKADVIVEKYIKGREFSVGVVDGEAYPIIEIAPISGFYDYKNKYQAGSTVETCPANISKELTEKMQKIAEQAFEVLGMKSYGRMDFMMDEQGNMYCLEANTLPGMTPTSLLPQEAAARGESFADLCEKLVRVSR